MVQSVETIALRPLSSATEALLLDVSKACFDAVLAAMKPGIAYADLIALWEKSATGAEYQAGRTMGHGLGLGQDEPADNPRRKGCRCSGRRGRLLRT